MLKLNASFSKKIPVPGHEFSSQSYHVSLEVELPANLTPQDLQTKISETFALARESVEAEIHGGTHQDTAQVINTTPSQAPRQMPARNAPQNNSQQGKGGRNSNEPASNKQVAFLTTLLKRQNYDIAATCANYQVQSLYDLTRKQCSSLIDEIQNAGQQAA